MKTYNNHGQFKVYDGSGAAAALEDYRNFIIDDEGFWHEIIVESWGTEPSFVIDPVQNVTIPAYGTQCDTILGTDGLYYGVTVEDWAGYVYGLVVGGSEAESNVFKSTLNDSDSEYYELRYDTTTSQPYLAKVS